MFDEIRLPEGMDSKAKTLFFKNLVKQLPGFSLLDVSDVYVSKPKKTADTNEEGNPEIRIDKASLRGQGVLESPELKSLEDKHGFYVSRIVWTAKQGSTDNDIYEFEAQFARPEQCTDFAYLPRGFYKYLGDGGYNSSRTGFSSEEEIKYGKLIEVAARSSLSILPGHSNG